MRKANADSDSLNPRPPTRPHQPRLEDLSALWDSEPRIAHEEIAKHFGKVTLKPTVPKYGQVQLSTNYCPYESRNEGTRPVRTKSGAEGPAWTALLRDEPSRTIRTATQGGKNLNFRLNRKQRVESRHRGSCGAVGATILEGSNHEKEGTSHI